MKLLPFKESRSSSIGIELEYQIINPKTFALVSRSKELIRNINNSDFKTWIKPEITQSMIEINTSIHHSPRDILDELFGIQQFLLTQASNLDVLFCGGGTHPFHKWAMEKIFPSWRYKNLLKKYRYLTKRATVFGLHIHIGCSSSDDALYLTHALTRYVPQLIAMSASSPFYQGVDTGFHSSRSTIFNAFPLSGVIPYLTTWNQFSDYFYKMKSLKIVASMKDFYWDIRPKPEYGTVELRVCDAPLTIKKAVIISAFLQALSLYLLTERPFAINEDIYYLYSYNRFQASRYGLEGIFINPDTLIECRIQDDIQATIKKIERYANQLNTMGFLSQLLDDVINQNTDARLIRQIHKRVNALPQVVNEQCKIWAQPF